MSIANNIPQISVGAVVDELASLYISVINNEIPFGTIPAPFLWGPPGVGKSDAIKQIAHKIEEATSKKVVVTDIRLLLFSPIDLRGVPVADSNKEFTEWLKPKIFDLDSSDDVVNIIILDELSAAPASVQAAAYQITLNRVIGEHSLPTNTVIIAAGNRTTDRSVAFRMPNALANRLMHFDINVDFDSWRTWAVNNCVNELVLGYLSYDNSKLYHEDVELDDMAFPTPRSWNFVSNILNSVGEIKDISIYHTLISSCIGIGNSLEFIAWCKVYKDMPKVEDIFSGKTSVYPQTQDALFGLVSAITAKLVLMEKTSPLSISITVLENVCRYANQFPVDFATCLYRNLCDVAGIKLKLLKTNSFKEWMKRNKSSMFYITM